MTCRCGCGELVKPGRVYADRAHVFRVQANRGQGVREKRAAWWSQQPPEAQQAYMARATRAYQRSNFETMIGRWLELAVSGEIRQALLQAHRSGYSAGYVARKRHQARKANAA